MKLAVLLAALTTTRSWIAWTDYDLRMIPDFALYTQGGIGLYPSPIGRTLGALGPDIFAAISSIASGTVVLLVALLARQHKCNSALAAILATFTPASLYLSYAGIDSIGLSLLLGALLYSSATLMVAAALTHLSLMPFALLLLPRTTWAVRAGLTILAATTIAAIMTTPYVGIIYGIFHPDVFVAVGLGALALLALAGPALLLGGTTRMFVIAAFIGLGECALQHHLQARYLLPAAFIAASHAHWNHSPLHRTWRKAAALTAALVAPVRQVSDER